MAVNFCMMPTQHSKVGGFLPLGIEKFKLYICTYMNILLQDQSVCYVPVTAALSLGSGVIWIKLKEKASMLY